MKQCFSQSEIIKLTLKFSESKKDIQDAINQGRIKTIIEFARIHSLPRSTATKIINELGLKFPENRQGKPKNGIALSNILTVIERVCKELNVNYDEIKPYL